MKMQAATISCLGAVLALSLGSTGCRRQPSDPILMLPHDTQIVVQVDMRAVRNTATFKKHAEEAQARADQAGNEHGLAQEAGFTLDDIDKVTVGAVIAGAAGAARPGPSDGVAVLSGRFVPERIRAAMAEKKRPREEVEGFEIFRDGRVGVAIINEGTLVAGDVDAVKNVIAVLKRKQKGLDEESSVLDGLPSFEPRGMIWMSAVVPQALWTEVDKNPLIAMMLANLTSITSVGASLDQQDPSRAGVAIYLHPGKPEEADLVRKSVEGVLRLATMGIRTRPGVTDAMDSLEITTLDEGLVKIHFTVPMEALEANLDPVLSSGAGLLER